MARKARSLAIVTGASTGIGYELAKCCADTGFDLVIAADEAEIEAVVPDFEKLGARVDAVKADLATVEGVDQLYKVIGNRPVDALLANAGRGLGKGFLDQRADIAFLVKRRDDNGNTHLADFHQTRQKGAETPEFTTLWP